MKEPRHYNHYNAPPYDAYHTCIATRSTKEYVFIFVFQIPFRPYMHLAVLWSHFLFKQIIILSRREDFYFPIPRRHKDYYCHFVYTLLANLCPKCIRLLITFFMCCGKLLSQKSDLTKLSSISFFCCK